jgi:hypothetical protein
MYNSTQTCTNKIIVIVVFCLEREGLLKIPGGRVFLKNKKCSPFFVVVCCGRSLSAGRE